MLYYLFCFGCTPQKLEIPPPPAIRPEVSTLDQNKTQSLVMMAWYCAHNLEWEKSFHFFTQALENEPNNIWIYVHLGDAAYSLEQVETARIAWKKAISLLLPSDIDMKLTIQQKIARIQ